MAETANIAAIAEKLSGELFAEFFWKRTGPMNENWACEKSEHHKVKTHPSDVVFYYDEPYTNQRTYVNCDLKSYATSSITTSALRGAVESLTKQVACAEISEEWRTKYTWKRWLRESRTTSPGNGACPKACCRWRLAPCTRALV